MTDATTLPRCTLTRRLAVVFYDTLLLLAVLFMAGALASAIVGNADVGSHPLYRTWLFMVSFFYFAWPWVNGGQTLGMRTWRVRVQRYDGGPITWWQALLRFMVAMASWAVLGAGFLWSLFDKQQRTWHDIYSESVLVVLPKKQIRG
jgi:uncharacterized RDD family membrane protein YckC